MEAKERLLRRSGLYARVWEKAVQRVAAEPHTIYFRSSTQAAPDPPSRGCANSTINTSLR